jgi:hypothetical protein
MTVESRLEIRCALELRKPDLGYHHHNHRDLHVDLEDHAQQVHLAGHRNIE